jgi:hypothetical protein
MKVRVQIPIEGSKEDIWKVITDIENATSRISGIEKVEIHHQPDEGVEGLKWTETRTLFGKTATETMWITEAEENHYYKTRAESHGAIYLSTMEISEEKGQRFLSMELASQAQSFGAKVMSVLLAPLFKNATKKALLKDLEDIKAAVEQA